MTPESRQIYLRLLKHVAPYWRTFALSITAMVVLAATEPAVAVLMKPIMDGSFVEKDVGRVGVMALLLIGVFVIRGLSSYLNAIALAWVAGKLVMDLRTRMFGNLLRMPAGFYDGHTSGTLISKFTYDATMVTDAGTTVLTTLVRDSLAITGLLAWMLYLDWGLTLIALVSTPVVVVIIKTISSRLRRLGHSLQDSMGDLTHVLGEAIGGQKVVRVFGAQDYEAERFSVAANWVRRYQMKFTSSSAAAAPAAQVISSFALAVILYAAARKSAADEVTIGEFISFFAAMAMLFGPLRRITNIAGPLQRSLAAAESVFKMVDQEPEPDLGDQVIERARGHIEFDHVTFSYASAATPALEDISLVIEPGETVALVGPSGGGKTTFANLVPRFYAVDSGRILLDGIDTQALTLASLRNNISLVSQEIILFNDTIRANIAYGTKAPIDETAVMKAARAAHVLEFVDELPEGLDTLVGEKGLRMSGGQRQRIAIARAFMKEAPILILDEATSSLDNESERHIQTALDTLRQGRTTIIIAHRLSTIENADRIAIVAEGRILETGTHKSLLETSSLYAGLYRFQFSRPESEAKAAG